MNKSGHLTVLVLLFFSLFALPIVAEEFKLSDDIIPSSQLIELRLDPAQAGYSGKTVIQLKVKKATGRIKLYSKDLVINSATLISERENTSVSLTVAGRSEYDITPLLAKNLIEKGEYRLSLSFAAKYTDTGSGLFKVIENKEHYLFTQFQAMLARSVFPAFDQPNFKIPFQFKITVPKGYLAISNTPQLQLNSQDDWQSYVFAPTKPIYTDVLAFAVGKFDSIDIPNMPIPSKLYVVKGKLAGTTYAANHIGKVYSEVQSFFSIDYPYSKLDMVAVPNYADGAMENVGLIYFKEDFVLLDEVPSTGQQKNTLKLIAHEIAHMWFGNLVTMQWWNDLWLNESFAEWLARKVVIGAFPELSAELDLPQIRSLSDDNVNTQLPIRRSVKSRTDTESMGGIAYGKGNAILNMIEHHVGEAVFRQAVISYLVAYQNKNATLQDFVKQFEAASKQDLSGFFRTFLDQPGFPLLSFKMANDRLLVSQQAFNGDQQNKNELLWHVPVMLKLFTDKGVLTQSIFVSQRAMEFALPKGVKAVFPDANAVGYYRYLLPPSDEAFIKNNISRLKDNEKLAWLENESQLSKINKRAYADVLSVKLALLSDLSLNPDIAANIVRDIDFSYTDFIPAALFNPYSQYLTMQLKPRLDAINWQGINQDASGQNSLTASLLSLAGGRLGHAKAVEFAKEHFSAILSEQSRLDAGISSAVLKVVAANSGEQAYLQYQNAYLKTTNSNLKSNILTAMGYFSEPQIVTRYFDFLLSGQVPMDEISYRFQYPSFNPALRHHVIDYIASHKDKILQSINQPQWFPYNFYTSCEAAIRVKVNQVFATWIKDVAGLEEKLNTIDDTIKQCIASRDKNLAQLEKLLVK